MLIDSGSTDNFIHCKVAKEFNFFLYGTRECQVTVVNRGTINCSRKCHNIKLTMGEYVVNRPMVSIPIGGSDVVLRVQWSQYLGTIAFNFQEMFLNVSSERKKVELQGIIGNPGKIISSNVMTKLLKK